MAGSTRATPPPLRRLLIGTDFSPGASRALTRVPRLPLARRADITVLHVLPAWMNRAIHIRECGQAERRLRREATRLLRALRSAGCKEVRVRTVLAQGDPHEEILRRAPAADLVIVGRHGRRSFRDLLVGSTAERVVRRAPVPTLLVARRARAPYRRALAAVDLSETSLPTLDSAARVLGGSGRFLDVVHAYHPEHEQLLHRVATRVGRAAYDRECRSEARRAMTSLLDASSAAPVTGALVLRRADPRPAIPHGRAGLAHWLLGSVAEAVIRHAICDVLVAPPERGSKRSRRRAA